MPASSKKIVLIQRFEIRKNRNDENYAVLTVNLGKDANYAAMPAKIWQTDRMKSAGKELPSQGQVIEATYREDEYNGTRQWTIEDYRRLAGRELEKAQASFVQPVRVDKDFYVQKLDELIERTDAGRVSGQVLREIFDRAEFRENFYKAPAAKTRHQNYPGGLLEHTLNVTCLAIALAEAYATPTRTGLTFNRELLPVDLSLLIAAGLLHDIGKIDTYKFAPISDVTDANSFEGHLPISYAIVRGAAQPLKAAPAYPGAGDEVDKLLNCILSHHGTLEFGSPVMPACVEAVILAQADVSDARLATIVSEGNQALRQNPEARFVRSQDFTGGVFVGDWPPPPAIK